MRYSISFYFTAYQLRLSCLDPRQWYLVIWSKIYFHVKRRKKQGKYETQSVKQVVSVIKGLAWENSPTWGWQTESTTVVTELWMFEKPFLLHSLGHFRSIQMSLHANTDTHTHRWDGWDKTSACHILLTATTDCARRWGDSVTWSVPSFMGQSDRIRADLMTAALCSLAWDVPSPMPSEWTGDACCSATRPPLQIQHCWRWGGLQPHTDRWHLRWAAHVGAGTVVAQRGRPHRPFKTQSLNKSAAAKNYPTQTQIARWHPKDSLPDA